MMNAWTRCTRRDFFGGAVALATMAAAPPVRPLKIGLIADPHHGLAPDALPRLQAFMQAVERQKPDFLLQLGDFCHPPRAVKSAKDFLRVFSSFHGPRYHVLGNHDLDLARNKREILDAWEMKKAFYSFDQGGFHFAVLDCNFVQTAPGKFVDWKPGHRYENRIHPEQLEWLKQDLANTALPTILISHQGFGPSDKGGVVPNGEAVRKVICEANQTPGSSKIVLCLHGHNHLDGACQVDGVHYVQLNSASYLWVGEAYGRMATYTDSLYAFLTLDPAGSIYLQGRSSTFRSPTPRQRRYPNAHSVTACISDRILRFRPRL